MPFRIVDQAPQFLISAGTKVLAGGTLTFYQSGTSVLQDTYTDPTLVTKNTNPVTIGVDGRTPDVWGSGNYRVVAADVLGAIQWTRDNVLGPADLPAQAGKSGDVLTTDGANLSWVAVVQVPNVTGQSGKMLVNDGTSPYWAPQSTPPTIPTVPTGGIVQTSSSFTIGKILVQTGSATCTASGSHTAAVSVTFAEAMSSCMYVGVSPTIAGVSSSGFNGINAIQAKSGTGFTVQFDINAAAGGTANITNNITFDYVALGLIP